MVSRSLFILIAFLFISLNGWCGGADDDGYFIQQQAWQIEERVIVGGDVERGVGIIKSFPKPASAPVFKSAPQPHPTLTEKKKANIIQHPPQTSITISPKVLAFPIEESEKSVAKQDEKSVKSKEYIEGSDGKKEIKP